MIFRNGLSNASTAASGGTPSARSGLVRGGSSSVGTTMRVVVPPREFVLEVTTLRGIVEIHAALVGGVQIDHPGKRIQVCQQIERVIREIRVAVILMHDFRCVVGCFDWRPGNGGVQYRNVHVWQLRQQAPRRCWWGGPPRS